MWGGHCCGVVEAATDPGHKMLHSRVNQLWLSEDMRKKRRGKERVKKMAVGEGYEEVNKRAEPVIGWVDEKEERRALREMQCSRGKRGDGAREG